MPPPRWRPMHLLAMSTLAITQPLLGILGDNPTFFTAHDTTPWQMVWFALVVALIPSFVLAAGAATVHLVRASAGRRAHLVCMAALGFLFAIQVVDVVPGPWPIPTVLAAALTAGFVVAYRRHPPVRSAVSLLAVTPVLFVALFLFVSPAQSVVFPGDVEAVELGDLLDDDALTDEEGGPSPETALSLTERVNARFPPIYLLILDELPMASLLDETGEIDAVRWPNFARLGATSHLFSNATTVGFTTERAVPAILAGTYETLDAPVYSRYPDNLFTLLGEIYDASSYDPLVDLCPPSVCNGEVPTEMVDLLAADREASSAAPSTTTTTVPTPQPTPAPRPDPSLRLLLDDATTVFGHLAAPEGLDLGLPSIGAGWGNFGDSAGGTAPPTTTLPPAPPTTATPTTTTTLDVEVGVDPIAEPDTVDADEVNRQNKEFLESLITDDSRVAEFRAEVSTIGASPVPRLQVTHALVPHVPWRLHENGEIYADIALPGYFSMWDDDPVTARAGLQRHLLQLRFTDQLLGEYLDRLSEEGIFDEAVVIVTADHGISFLPGLRSRGVDSANTGGIAGVPIFFKQPGQTEPARHHHAVETVDLLPTIAAQLEVEPPWPLEGHDLFGPEADRVRAILHPFWAEIPEPFQPVMDAVTADLLDAFASGTDGNLYALAGLGDRIGTSVVDLVGAPSTACWRRERPTAIPDREGATGYVYGRVSTSGSDTVDLAIVVAGVLTGTTRTLDHDVAQRVFGFGDPRLWRGATIDEVEIHEIVDGALHPLPACR